jgi:hypothetical protein
VKFLQLEVRSGGAVVDEDVIIQGGQVGITCVRSREGRSKGGRH